MALWSHMATEIWVNIGSGNGLLPDGTKPLPEPRLTNYQRGLVAFIWFIWGEFHRECSGDLSLIWVWKLSPWCQWDTHCSATSSSIDFLLNTDFANQKGWLQMMPWYHPSADHQQPQCWMMCNYEIKDRFLCKLHKLWHQISNRGISL